MLEVFYSLISKTKSNFELLNLNGTVKLRGSVQTGYNTLSLEEIKSGGMYILSVGSSIHKIILER